MSQEVYCENCRYLARSQPNPFSPETSSNPKVMEQWPKWSQKLKEIEQAERQKFNLLRQAEHQNRPQRLDFRALFTAKPLFYSWCRHWTELGRKNWKKDQFGNDVKVYELTAIRNKNHDCVHFTEKEPDGGQDL
jgi:hypothetical protein